MKDDVTLKDVVAALRADGCCIGTVAEPEEYHAWKAELEAEFGCPVVSKSVLADFAAGAYMHHWNKLHGVKKESSGLAFGSAVDCRVLTPKLWEARYCVEEINRRTKAGKERAEELEAQGKTALKPAEFEVIEAAAKRANNHLAAECIRFTAQVGMWAYLKEVDGEPLPCPVIVTGMIDILPDEDCPYGDEILDLKTTSADVQDTQALFYAVEDFRYGIQAAIYLDLFNLCEPDEKPRTGFGFLFVGSSAPAMSRMVMIDSVCIAAHRAEYCALLRQYCTAWASGEWGSPQLESVYYTPTRRAAARFQELMRGEVVEA